MCVLVAAALLLTSAMGAVSTTVSAAGVNPPDTYMRARLKDAALRYNIPPILLMAIAWQESGWRQFNAAGEPIIGSNATSFDIGIMQINSQGRTDIDRLKADIDYNIEIGARILDGKWKQVPGIGDRDRNVLENWYYAIWAYNGFSSTNNPNTPGGRHYQLKVLALASRQLLGSDGQPLWPPVAITLPDPALITDPPVWIPTPQPVHYADLYGGLNQGDNFRVLESPAGGVVPADAGTRLSFVVQNVGTTTWDSTYQAVVTAGDPVVAVPTATALEGLQPGATANVTALLPAGMSEGQLAVTLAMNRGGTPFGLPWVTPMTVVPVGVAMTVPDTVTLGDTLVIPFQVTCAQSLTITPLFELRDAEGSLVDSSLLLAARHGGQAPGIPFLTVPEQSAGELRYFVAGTDSRALRPGIYELSIALVARTVGEQGLEGMPTVYASRHQLNVLPGSGPGLLLIDSSPRGAGVAIDGIPMAQVTPCAVATLPGLHTVTVADPQMSPYAAAVDTSLEPTTLVSAVLAPLVPAPPVLTASIAFIDVGALKDGVGITAGLQVIAAGSAGQATGVVTTSTNWIRISPVRFTGNQQFTLGIDVRWIDPNQLNTGTVAFTLGDATVRVSVSAGFAPAPVSLVLAPQALTVGEGDEFQLDLTARNLQALFDRVELVVAWNPDLVSLLAAAPGTPLTPDGALSPEGGTLRVAGTIAGMDAEHAVLASLLFKALVPTAKTGIDLRGTISLASAPVRASCGGSGLIINPHFEAPGTPASLKAAGESGAVRLTWISPAAGTYPLRRYDVYRCLGSAGLESAELVAELKPGIQQYLDRGLLERSTYTYWVIAEDEKGNVGSPAGPVAAKPIIRTETATLITLVFTIGKPVVVMNGVVVAMEAAPVIENGRTILPVRYVATPLGAQVLWDSHDQKVTLIGTSRIELWIGKPTARVDGIDTPIDPANSSVVPRIISGRTMLPLRFITETLGADVAFEARTGTVTVTFQTGEGQ